MKLCIVIPIIFDGSTYIFFTVEHGTQKAIQSGPTQV